MRDLLQSIQMYHLYYCNQLLANLYAINSIHIVLAFFFKNLYSIGEMNSVLKPNNSFKFTQSFPPIRIMKSRMSIYKVIELQVKTFDLYEFIYA